MTRHSGQPGAGGRRRGHACGEYLGTTDPLGLGGFARAGGCCTDAVTVAPQRNPRAVQLRDRGVDVIGDDWGHGLGAVDQMGHCARGEDRRSHCLQPRRRHCSVAQQVREDLRTHSTVGEQHAAGGAGWSRCTAAPQHLQRCFALHALQHARRVGKASHQFYARSGSESPPPTLALARRQSAPLRSRSVRTPSVRGLLSTRAYSAWTRARQVRSMPGSTQDTTFFAIPSPNCPRTSDGTSHAVTRRHRKRAPGRMQLLNVQHAGGRRE